MPISLTSPLTHEGLSTLRRRGQRYAQRCDLHRARCCARTALRCACHKRTSAGRPSRTNGFLCRPYTHTAGQNLRRHRPYHQRAHGPLHAAAIAIRGERHHRQGRTRCSRTRCFCGVWRSVFCGGSWLCSLHGRVRGERGGRRL